MNKRAGQGEFSIVDPDITLERSLTVLISEAKEGIQECLGLDGKKQRLSAAKLEKQLRVIGGAVEARAVHLKGWASVEDFRITIGSEIVKARKAFTNEEIATAEEIAQEVAKAIEETDIKYPNTYPHRMWPKNKKQVYRLCVNLNKDCRKAIRQIRKNSTVEELGMSNRLFELREAYILALSEIRPFGGTILVEDWFEVLREKRAKGFIPYGKEEPSGIEKVKALSKMLPSDWITISNNASRPLLIRAWRYSILKTILCPPNLGSIPMSKHLWSEFSIFSRMPFGCDIQMSGS